MVPKLFFFHLKKLFCIIPEAIPNSQIMGFENLHIADKAQNHNCSDLSLQNRKKNQKLEKVLIERCTEPSTWIFGEQLAARKMSKLAD